MPPDAPTSDMYTPVETTHDDAMGAQDVRDLAAKDSPDLIAAWVLIGAAARKHIVDYVNEHGHVPPWALRELAAERNSDEI